MFHATGDRLALPSALAGAERALDCTPTQPLSGAASEPLALGLDSEHGGGGGDDFGIASDIHNPLVSA